MIQLNIEINVDGYTHTHTHFPALPNKKVWGTIVISTFSTQILLSIYHPPLRNG